MSVSDQSNVESQQPLRTDPPIFEKLSLKTQGYLRKSQKYKEQLEMASERTFIAVKPDGVQRGLFPETAKRFEQKGYKLVGIKIVTPSKAHMEKHYEDLSSKPFFPGLVKFMADKPIIAMVWEGRDVVKGGRKLLGETNPAASAPGTLRFDFCIDVGRNLVHGSDSVESANKEIAHWFEEKELVQYESAVQGWVYES
ncbi:MAG: nucleoside diphosphate kinase [Thelocarpon impressellum]|nr:MAG: nucleoside diphosphate kinase [Thelocarpon impressellum]